MFYMFYKLLFVQYIDEVNNVRAKLSKYEWKMYQMKGYLHYLHYSVVKSVPFVSKACTSAYLLVEAFLASVLDPSCKPCVVTRGRWFDA